jgi:hypothetical protein
MIKIIIKKRAKSNYSKHSSFLFLFIMLISTKLNIPDLIIVVFLSFIVIYTLTWFSIKISLDEINKKK